MCRSVPRRGYTPQPRVAQRTLGTKVSFSGTLKGFDKTAFRTLSFVEPFQGSGLEDLAFPGCAARPWAVGCNPFGVQNSTCHALQRSLPAWFFGGSLIIASKLTNSPGNEHGLA